MLSAASSGKIAVDTIFPAICMILVILRFVARRKRNLDIQLDDWLIVGALICAVGIGFLGIYGATKDGRETWVENEKIHFAELLIAHTLYALAKLSILFFFKRIFVGARFTLASNVLIGLVVAWWITAIVGQLVVKIPIETWWTLDGAAFQAYGLFNFNIWLLAMTCIDMVLDVLVFALPIPLIVGLHMSTERKIKVAGIFGLAIFCVVASGVRIYWSYTFWKIIETATAANEIALSSFERDVWAHVEGFVAIITACLPCLGPLMPDSKAVTSIIHSLRSMLSPNTHRQSYGNSRSQGFEAGQKSDPSVVHVVALEEGLGRGNKHEVAAGFS